MAAAPRNRRNNICSSTAAATAAAAWALLALSSLVAASEHAIDLKIYGCLEEGTHFPNGHCPHRLSAYKGIKDYPYPHVSILNSGDKVSDAELAKYEKILKDFSHGEKAWSPDIKSLIVHGPKDDTYQVELSGGSFHHHSGTIEKLVEKLDASGLANDHGAKGRHAGYHITVPATWVDTKKSPPELHDKSREYLEGKDSKLKWYLGDQNVGVIHELKVPKH